MIDRAVPRQSIVMKMVSSTAAALVASIVALTGCSGGGDVYVGEKPSDQQSASSTGCIMAVDEDVCANTAKYASPPPSPETIDTILAVVDFGAIAVDSASVMMRACGSILDELQIQRPQPAPTTEPPGAPSLLDIGRMAASYCDAASTAIRVRLQGASPTITVSTPPAACTSRSHACGTSGAAKRQSCTAPEVTVDVGAAPTPEQLALRATLEKHLPAVLASKGELEQMVNLSGKISGNASAIATLSPSCTVTLASTISTSATLAQNAAEAAGRVFMATQ